MLSFFSCSRPCLHAMSLIVSVSYRRTMPYSFFFSDPATTEIYTLSLHDALPICPRWLSVSAGSPGSGAAPALVPPTPRSEEHTSELQSHSDLVCRLLLEKKKDQKEHIYRKSYINPISASREEKYPIVQNS